MILRLTMEVKDEVHQNEVLNRVEATGAQLLGAEAIVGGKSYRIAPPQTIVPVTPLLDPMEYQKWVIEVEKRMGMIAPMDDPGDDKALSALEDMGYMTDQPEMVEHMTFLTYLAQYCTNILEIGCGHGNGSTRAFERGLKLIENPSWLLKHITVDIDSERPQIKPNIASFYYYKAVEGDSREARTYKTVLRHAPFDLIYIDTEHTYEVMQAELNTLHAEGLIHDNVLLVFHDTWMFGEYNRMTDAIKEFAQSLGWVFNDYTKVSHGLGLLYSPGGDWHNLICSIDESQYYPNKV